MSDGRPRPDCSHGPQELNTLCGACWLELKDENAQLRREVHQLRQRSSPATEPCACPEFCTYHARVNFESLQRQLSEERERCAKTVEGFDGWIWPDKNSEAYREAGCWAGPDTRESMAMLADKIRKGDVRL